MFFYEGMSCPVCGQAFQENEDIVACPECGAPHHRSCWQKEGHCHYAAQHGTSEQWKRPDADRSANSDSAAANGRKRCPHCGTENPEFAEFCSHCARPLDSEDWARPSASSPSSSGQAPGQVPPPPPYREYTPYAMPTMDPFGGIPKTEVIDGETVEDIAAAVGQNTGYYLPRFFRMSRGGGRVSWNWAAFLLTPYWLLYRKSYLFGLLTLVFQMFYSFLSSYVSLVLFGSRLNDTSISAMMQSLETLMNDPTARPYFLLVAALGLFSFLLRFVFGLLGNYLYKETSLGRIRRLKANSPESYKIQLPAVGGVSFLLGMLGYFIAEMATLLVQLL